MRVAIVAGSTPAAAFPAAGLAARLVANGDQVLLLTGRRWVERMVELGLPAEAWPEPVDADQAGGQDTRRPADLAADVAAVPATRARLEEFRPDLVVNDVRTTVGGLTAELLRLPWVQLHPRPLPFGTDPDRPGRPSRRGVARPGRRARGRAAEQDLEAARESLGLAASGPGPRLHMVATLPDLEPPRLDWPGNASVVGPLIWDPAVVDLPAPAGHDPLVLVSPSTSSAVPDTLLETALRGLQDVRLAGTVLEPYDASLPDWASIGPGRQGPLLAEAAVVVTGGGHGMIARALTAGVPLVLAPDSGEMDLAHATEQLGVAVVVRRASPRSLRNAVERVIEDREYAAAARQVARTVTPADPVVLCHQALVGRTVGLSGLAAAQMLRHRVG